MLSCFHLIPERNGRTNRQTDGRTDGQTDRFAISISRVNVLTRDKNYTTKRILALRLSNNKCVSKTHIRQMREVKLCATPRPHFKGNICVADCMPLFTRLKRLRMMSPPDIKIRRRPPVTYAVYLYCSNRLPLFAVVDYVHCTL